MVAFSLSPEIVSGQVEHGVPSLNKRLQAISQLADHGWKIGLRFDPLIAFEGAKQAYEQLCQQLMQACPVKSIHSVSVGVLRFPERMYQKIRRMYPEEAFLAKGLHKRGKMRAYSEEVEHELKNIIRSALADTIDGNQIFSCEAL